MANLRNPEIINFLRTSRLYRWRTNVIFGVMWYTDGHRWWSSVTSSEMVTLEIIWGENRLRNFDLRDFDNAIIAEGQYIAKFISDTCFSVMDFLDILYEEEEEERVAEWNRLVRYVRQAAGVPPSGYRTILSSKCNILITLIEESRKPRTSILGDEKV
ncbi:hypothetical protein FANTH_5651 [Fusarium anthophilum]|uniref:Uncharacterized protein n=1 Tax=Fusarium anthophilum TaxID=48485 RepID=A0A8H4ZL40_9HYPO|nr:hypothetical protein FANTH_5651 [Fusarium anthophilum]